MEEKWVPIITWLKGVKYDYEGLYQVSSEGRIRSLNYRKRGYSFIMSPGRDKDGYRYICLMKNGKKKWFKVHRLVWEAFNGPIPYGYEINHLNEIKDDNRLVNLSLVSHKQNINYGNCSARAGRKHRLPVLQYDLNGNFIARWESESAAGETLNIDVGQISACCRHKPHYNSAGQFLWEYEKKEQA